MKTLHKLSVLYARKAYIVKYDFKLVELSTAKSRTVPMLTGAGTGVKVHKPADFAGKVIVYCHRENEEVERSEIPIAIIYRGNLVGITALTPHSLMTKYFSVPRRSSNV